MQIKGFLAHSFDGRKCALKVLLIYEFLKRGLSILVQIGVES